MKPESTPNDDLLLFQAHFEQLLNPSHPLIKLANQIDWAAFDDAFGELVCPDHGAPAKLLRLLPCAERVWLARWRFTLCLDLDQPRALYSAT